MPWYGAGCQVIALFPSRAFFKRKRTLISPKDKLRDGAASWMAAAQALILAPNNVAWNLFLRVFFFFSQCSAHKHFCLIGCCLWRLSGRNVKISSECSTKTASCFYWPSLGQLCFYLTWIVANLRWQKQMGLFKKWAIYSRLLFGGQ